MDDLITPDEEEKQTPDTDHKKPSDIESQNTDMVFYPTNDNMR